MSASTHSNIKSKPNREEAQDNGPLTKDTPEYENPRLISFLRAERIAELAMLQRATLDRLVLFDENEDAVCPPNRLLLSYPGLHEFIRDISNRWAENKIDTRAEFSRLIHTNEPTPEGNNLERRDDE